LVVVVVVVVVVVLVILTIVGVAPGRELAGRRVVRQLGEWPVVPRSTPRTTSRS